jgi:PKHD-type hydroxylase
MILTLPDLLSPHEVQSARRLLADAPWGDGRDSAGPQARAVKNNEQLPHDCEAATLHPSPGAGGLERSPPSSPPRCRRRSSRRGQPLRRRGQCLRRPHRQRHPPAARRPAGAHRPLLHRVPVRPRRYDGGELVVADTYRPRSIKLPAGHAVLYPGTSVHQVEPVTRGERLACFFWVESLVRSDEQRRLLYDTGHEPDEPAPAPRRIRETTALTGTYHNLLRLWADT